MKRTLATLAVVLMGAASTAALARAPAPIADLEYKPAHCFVSLDGRTLVNGQCRRADEEDSVVLRFADYFAILDANGDVTLSRGGEIYEEVYYSKVPNKGGRCRLNKRIRICVWK
jgi:hypothetical protein